MLTEPMGHTSSFPSDSRSPLCLSYLRIRGTDPPPCLPVRIQFYNEYWHLQGVLAPSRSIGTFSESAGFAMRIEGSQTPFTASSFLTTRSEWDLSPRTPLIKEIWGLDWGAGGICKSYLRPDCTCLVVHGVHQCPLSILVTVWKNKGASAVT